MRSTRGRHAARAGAAAGCMRITAVVNVPLLCNITTRSAIMRAPHAGTSDPMLLR